MKTPIHVTINDRGYDLLVEPRKTLLAVLREQLRMTGTKEGCSTGDCGACTVLLDGKPVTSCLVLAVEADGRDVLTVEGIAEGGKLHPVQEAMIELGGLQCGFCTSGVVVSGIALLEENPKPTEGEIRQALAGNLCRCTGYTKIVEAVQLAARKMGRRRPARAASGAR
ncbi:MAG: (2Fe-2S)-binding protein [Candidatus Latescibacteria bacterium]|jgi:carbon-monoxide dehydrogenase small subunit|nr:ferredoxin [Gemmatimonadaceae bacterium]MDP6017233.1 (2Fe-2S)-binding protein [Candidatus Latescibacterota bacterium]MDP7447502.1 (2Fe-2S)-binding protein [Candidatus Latescibacterota bacterium]HJP33009.1 (2Fe-2S)-binding protein [Candidatus Latescibacterota bacterium]